MSKYHAGSVYCSVAKQGKRKKGSFRALLVFPRVGDPCIHWSDAGPSGMSAIRAMGRY